MYDVCDGWFPKIMFHRIFCFSNKKLKLSHAIIILCIILYYINYIIILYYIILYIYIIRMHRLKNINEMHE